MFQKGYRKILVLSVFILTILVSSVAEAKALSAAEKGNTGTSSLASMAVPNSSHSCSPIVTGNKAGLNGTTHKMAFDGSLSTFFESSHNNWQFIQIDFQCTGTFSGLRRYMTRDGDNASGNRGLQGEGVSYSLDGVNWTNLTNTTSNGWQIYTNYAPHAWHSVSYGWSYWLKLNTPVTARYVRFNWDDNSDAVNEIEVDFAPDSVEADLHCDAGGGVFICTATGSGGSGGNNFSWQITAGNATITRIFTGTNVSTAIGTCQIGQVFGIDVTVQDSTGHSDTAHRSPQCHTHMP